MAEPLVHRGLHHSRIEGDCEHHNCQRERVFADEWERRQSNDGWHTLLMRVPCKADDEGAQREHFTAVFGDYYNRWPLGNATERDAVIAATVFQWLGTNVGFSELRAVLEKAGYCVARVRE